MLIDTQYLTKAYQLPEIKHCYGPKVHILADPYLFTTLAKLCRPECKQPLINQYLDTLYRELVKYVVNNEFPLVESEIRTRMHTQHAEAHFKGLQVDPSTRVVCVNLARAGTVPSQICFDAFNYLLNPDGIRQDHISINRKTDEREQVIGTHLGAVKIGGDVTNSVLVFPDPMGATGSTIVTAMEIYRERGVTKKIIAMHLIVTPEYITRVTHLFPDLNIYALRLDRGLSPAKCLNSIPGTYLAEERGLNPKQYIVPGAGGLGEVINNAYV